MSDLTLIIGNKNYSSWSLRPWVFMKHFNINFIEKRIALFTDSTNAKLAKYNSDFKVPILQDGEHVIWDSLAILEYLSENYLSNNGWPKEKFVRAKARSISAEMHSSFINMRNELPMNCRKQFNYITLSDNAQHEVQRISSLWHECRENYAHHGPWLFGEYSIADAMFAPVAFRFKGYNLKLDSSIMKYIETTLSQPYIEEWIDAARAEKEVIEEDEI